MSQFVQTILAALLIGVTGGLWAMYNRVQGHSATLKELREDIVENKVQLAAYDARLRSVETMVTEIKVKVEQIPVVVGKLDQLLDRRRLED